jgi:hypothetical protein
MAKLFFKHHESILFTLLPFVRVFPHNNPHINFPQNPAQIPQKKQTPTAPHPLYTTPTQIFKSWYRSCLPRVPLALNSNKYVGNRRPSGNKIAAVRFPDPWKMSNPPPHRIWTLPGSACHHLRIEGSLRTLRMWREVFRWGCVRLRADFYIPLQVLHEGFGLGEDGCCCFGVGGVAAIA